MEFILPSDALVIYYFSPTVLALPESVLRCRLEEQRRYADGRSSGATCGATTRHKETMRRQRGETNDF
jgi:hypothetical protein